MEEKAMPTNAWPHLAAIRRIRAKRLEELMRDLEEGQLNSGSQRNMSDPGSADTSSEKAAATPHVR
jgi:hypothetical protein